MREIDLKVSTSIERWGEKSFPRVWRFGAAYALVWFVIEAAAFLFVMPFRHWLLFLGAAFAVHAITFMLQLIIRRPRPVHHRSQPYKLWIHTYSFPSAHASSSFGCAVLGSVAAFQFIPEAAGFLVTANFIFAAYISFSRVTVGVHYLGDVIAGSVLGAITGLLFASLL